MENGTPITLPVGGFNGAQAASAQTRGTYSEGTNVRGVDMRSERVRLSQRPGMAKVGDGLVATVGDAVRATFRIGRDAPIQRYVQLTTTTQTGVTPSDVAIEWDGVLDGEPLALTIGPDGSGYALIDNGAVAIVNTDGTVVDTVPSQRPQNFAVTQAVAVDEQGGVYVAYSYPQQVGGGAGRVYRMIKTAEGTWEQAWELVFLGIPVHFVYGGGELYVVEHRPDDLETGPDSALTRIGSALTSLPSQVWSQEVAHPAVRCAVNEKGEVFIASQPNPGRSETAVTGFGTPSVNWTPMEPVTTPGEWPAPEEELFFWNSAERGSLVQGLYDGEAITLWEGARQDPSNYDPIIDVEPAGSGRGRGFVQVEYPNGSLLAAPTFDLDGAQTRPGIRFEAADTAPQRLWTLRSVSNHEKTSSTGHAPHQATMIPTMGLAGAVGAKFQLSIAMRLQNWADGATVLTTDKVVFEEGLYKLVYRYDGTGTDVTLEFFTPDGSVSPAVAISRGTHTIALTTTTDEFNVIFTFVHGGDGVAGASEWYVNGTAVSGGFQMDTNRAFSTLSRTTIGGPRPDGGTGEGMTGWIYEIVTRLGATTTNPHDTVPTGAEIARLEAFVAYRYGIQAAIGSPGVPAGTGDPLLPTGTTDSVNTDAGLLAKYSSTGEPRWVVSGNPYGNGVCTAPGGRVYTIGTPLLAAPGSTTRLRRLDDKGSTVIETGPTVWGVTATTNMRWARQGVDLFADSCGNLYVPWAEAESGSTRELRRYAADGDGLGFSVLDWSIDLGKSDNDLPLAVAGIGPVIDYSATGGPCGHESLFVASARDSFQIRRVSNLGIQDADTASTRSVELLAVTASGSLRRRDGASYTELVSGAFTGLRPWAATVYPYTVFGDGKNPYRVYDARSQQVRLFESSTKGEVPPRSPVGFAWRRRFGVIDPRARHQMALSAFGDVFDFEEAREVITATQAVTSTFSTAAAFPDLIRGVVPWNDDLLLVGCDSSWWRLTGDPMTGGQQDQLIPGIGLADDWAWAVDPSGGVWFLGTDRNVWRMSPDGQRQPMAGGTLRALLSDIDLTLFRVELEWSHREEGLWLVVIPRSGWQQNTHWFYEARTGGWHPVNFDGGADRVLTSIGSFDGDGPDDQATILGFADGQVRMVDRYALDDDGVPIQSGVLIGPLVGAERDMGLHLQDVSIALAADQGDVTVGARGSHLADVSGDTRREFMAKAGRRMRLPMNLRASHVWLDLRGAGRPWAVEELSANLTSASRRTTR